MGAADVVPVSLAALSRLSLVFTTNYLTVFVALTQA